MICAALQPIDKRAPEGGTSCDENFYRFGDLIGADRIRLANPWKPCLHLQMKYDLPHGSDYK
ncbi:hypothetical protein Acsp01_83840 [Actinoplanes sp. NBRC 101535]|nr:hypothetical protein Acsp01_83840 [Actinoplanes sp. NBRC 101535]